MSFENFNPNQIEQKEKEKTPVEASLEFLKEKWETANEELRQISGIEITDMGKLKESVIGFAAITTTHGIWEMADRVRGMEPFQLKGHLLLDAFILSPFIAIAIRDAIEAIKVKRKPTEGNIEN